MGSVARIAAILLFLSAGPVLAGPPTGRYTVRVAPDLTALDVHACFAGTIPDVLIGPSHLANPALQRATARFNGHRVTLKARGHRLALSPQPEDGCVDYRVDLQRIRSAEPNFDTAIVRDASLLLGTGTWLWQPPNAATQLHFHFLLPDGVQLSAPWSPTGPGQYRAATTPYTWKSSILLGQFYRFTLTVGGSRLEVAVAGQPNRQAQNRIRDWIHTAAHSATQVLGRLPVERLQILVVPLDAGRDTAAYAATARGGGPALHLTFNPSLPADAFQRDWILIHEFSHLLLPYVDHEASWLSEGLASYYQNVLRARGGQLSRTDAWASLVAGLDRGDRGTDPQLTLHQAAHAAARYGQIMRVYWSGAAIFLSIDARLRIQSDNRQSLDSVLRAFNRCCRTPDRTWSGAAMLAKFDALSGTTLFSDTAHRYVYSRHFPNLRPLLRELGVMPRGDGIELRPDAPAASVRRAIMQPYPAAESSSGHSSGRPEPRQARSQLGGASPSRKLPGAR